MPAREELPSTLRRSPKKAQETWSKAHDSAVETYGESPGRSSMTKDELGRAVARANDRATARARRG
jgi:pyrrolidone-carboxylate peptidase